MERIDVIAEAGQAVSIEVTNGGAADETWHPDHEPKTIVEFRFLASDLGRGKRPCMYDPDNELRLCLEKMNSARWDEARMHLTTAIAEMETFTEMLFRVSVIEQKEGV